MFIMFNYLTFFFLKGSSQIMDRTAQDAKTQEALSQIVKEFTK